MDVSDGEEEFKEIPAASTLDLGPITKKSAVLSPDDMLSPEEMGIEQEEEFESKALLKGTIIYNRFEVLRVISEQKDRNTYLVKDVKETNKKFILKEILPPPMTKEDYRDRRNSFRDTIRILNTFKHPNLVNVYDGFTENNREYYFMERVEGIDVIKLNEMNTKFFSDREVVKWGLQLCDATEFLHYRPIPFTLGELEPRHIMVDDSGTLRISGYDLQRFFDIKRTLAFLPDDPTKLYGDITKIARILYFLLTKKFYGEDDFEDEWPVEVSLKMQKLIGLACKEGQKSYGDIKVFKDKLADTLVEDKEVEKRRFFFNFAKMDFSWLVRGINAFINQRPAMLIFEGLALAFIIFFLVFNRQAQTRELEFQRPPGPVVWLFAGDEMDIFDANKFDLIYNSKNMKHRVSAMFPATLMIKEKGKDKKEEKNVILTGFESLAIINMMDSKNMKSLGAIRSNSYPVKMVYNDDDKLLYMLHPGNSSITVVSLESHETVNVFMAGLKPADIAVMPLDSEARKKREELLKLQNDAPDLFAERNEAIPFPTLVVSNAGSRDILFLNAHTGESLGGMKIAGVPGRIGVNVPRQKLYVIDSELGELNTIDMKNRKVEKRMPIPGSKPAGVVLDPIADKMWVAMSGSDSLNIIDLAKGKTLEVKSVGIGPEIVILDRDTDKLWVTNTGRKDVVVLEAGTGKVIRRLTLGKVPTSMCIEGHRYFY
jgi:DNA-binding beta-propeller fold protein YncE